MLMLVPLHSPQNKETPPRQEGDNSYRHEELLPVVGQDNKT